MILDLLVGPPGSGKSTYAKKQKGTYINQDSQKKDHIRLFHEAILRKEDIIVDRMGFSKEQRARYIDPAKAAGYEIITHTFFVPRKVCMERVLARKDHETIKDSIAANSAINLFFAKYESVTDEETPSRYVIEYDEVEKQPAIICDLDGTLCNIDHRLHFVRKNVEGRRPNWPAFARGVKDDTVNEWCAELLHKFVGDHEIVFCSGRDETSREATEKWLKEHKLWYGHLFMRSAGDHRQDSIIKENILDFDILPQFNPKFMVDDRQQVVDMWRKRGFVCLQCAKGDF